MTIPEMAEELARAAQYDGTELGEYWTALAALAPHHNLASTQEFREAYESELIAEFGRLKQDFEIVSEEQTQTVRTCRLRHRSERN